MKILPNSLSIEAGPWAIAVFVVEQPASELCFAVYRRLPRVSTSHVWMQ